MDFLKGLARGLTADTLGMPVDAAAALLNLGLAGGGALAHEVGLIDADQLPELIEKPVGGSEWLAEKGGVQGKGPAYERGRLVPAALGLGAGLAAAVKPRFQPGRLNALQLIPEELSSGVPLSGTRMKNITGESDYVLPKERVEPRQWADALAKLQSRGELALGEIGGAVARIPQLANRKIKHENFDGTVLGASYPNYDALDLRKIKNPAELARVVSHETQHGADRLVQRASIGGNPGHMAKIQPDAVKIARDWYPADEFQLANASPSRLYQDLLGERNARLSEALARLPSPASPAVLKALESGMPQKEQYVEFTTGLQSGLLPAHLLQKGWKIVDQGTRKMLQAPNGQWVGSIPQR